MFHTRAEMFTLVAACLLLGLTRTTSGQRKSLVEIKCSSNYVIAS